jgi:hypothetical protein
VHFSDTPDEAFEYLREHLLAVDQQPAHAQEATAPALAKTRG